VEQILAAVAAAAGDRCRVVVNGRPDVALAAGAHGVHLPSRGLPVAAVRSLAPPPFIVGVSTHTPAEVEAALSAGADYVFFGPVFHTATHPGATGTGPGGLVPALKAAAGMPLWAIGGIHERTVGALGQLPLAGVAAIRALLLADDPEAAVRALGAAPTSRD
jgi:thiamine-phosphate pyrophosphorylase